MNGSASVSIVRPRYAKDKRISRGMRLFSEEGACGRLVARHRAPTGGGIIVGVVISAPTEGDVGEVSLMQNAPRQVSTRSGDNLDADVGADRRMP